MKEIDIHYTYDSNSEVVGKFTINGDYKVYKTVNGWHLIGNNQWINSNELSKLDEVDNVIETPSTTPMTTETLTDDEMPPVETTWLKKIGRFFTGK